MNRRPRECHSRALPTAPQPHSEVFSQKHATTMESNMQGRIGQGCGCETRLEIRHSVFVVQSFLSPAVIPDLDRESSVFAFFVRGVAPRDEVPSLCFLRLRSATLRTGSFVSVKGPKTIGARAWPQEVPLPQSRLLGLRNSLCSDSPRLRINFSGPGRSHARRRREKVLAFVAIPNPRLKTSGTGFDRGSSVFVVVGVPSHGASY